MPPTHTDEGLRAAHRIRAEHPRTAVLVLSQYVDEASALELLSESSERTGYLLKDRIADVESFIDAVRRVAVLRFMRSDQEPVIPTQTVVR